MKQFLTVLMICGALVSFAQEVHANSLFIDLAQDRVEITTGFDGAELVLHGVKKPGGEIAVVIRGVTRPMVVRMKERILGMWINKAHVKFKEVPVYYDYALSDLNYNPELEAVLNKNNIGLDALNFDPKGGIKKIKKIKDFQEALVRNKQLEGLFPKRPQKIILLQDDFFRTSFFMPSNLPTGYYYINAYFINDGKIQEEQVLELNVGQVGLGAHVYKFAQTQSLAYGLICIFIAAFIGWASNRLRRQD